MGMEVNITKYVMYVPKEGFHKGKLIHKAIGRIHEGLHAIKATKLPIVVIKLDMSKAYDCVSWLYMRLLLFQSSFG